MQVAEDNPFILQMFLKSPDTDCHFPGYLVDGQLFIVQFRKDDPCYGLRVLVIPIHFCQEIPGIFLEVFQQPGICHPDGSIGDFHIHRKGVILLTEPDRAFEDPLILEPGDRLGKFSHM